MSTLQVSSSDASDREVHLQVTGGPAAGWAWIVPATLLVPAGATASARIVFAAPRGAKLPAGSVPFGITVTGGTEHLVVQGTVGIGEFHDLFVALRPMHAVVSGGSSHRLKVENRGNAVVRADLDATASSDVSGPAERALTVTVEPPSIVVEPGDSAEAVVTVEALARPRRSMGGQHRFEVVVRPGAPAKTVTGTLPTPQRRAVPRTPLLAGAVAVLVAGGLGLRATVLTSEQSRPGAAESAVNAACPAEGHVGRGRDGNREPPTASGYTFLSAGGDGGCFPARFNPCEPVSYVLNDALAPPGGVAEVREAIARVAEATGIAIVDAGTSDEQLATSRSPYQPERYGQRWAPILIGWSSGVLELNVDAVRDRSSGAPLPSGFGRGVTTGRVILHELGHVFGLGHPSGRDQLMYDELAEHTLPEAAFGIGDRAGLRLLGAAAGCVDVPPLPLGPATPR